MGAVGVSALEMRIKFFMNFPLGVFFGCIATLFLLWIVDSSNSSQIEEIALKIFLGVVGLLAASLALFGVLTSV